jgi:alpha-tubulin suppressor-like RCC1 family protein/uncharacterized protein YkwD
MHCANANTPARLLTQNAAEAAVLCLINEKRAEVGANPLTLNPWLRAAARQHANDARTIKWWAGGGSKIHVNPVTGSKPQDRIKGAGYCPEEPNCPMNENGYAAWYQGGPEFQGGTTPQAAVTWWMNSQGHRDTLLDPVYNETGIAVVLGVAETGTGADTADGGVIVVQTFGACRNPELLTLGELWDWGRNDVGQLGDGSTTDRHQAIHPEGFADVIALAGGRGHSFALLGDGSVLAWGFNALGQLGDGTTTNRLNPVQLPLDHVTAIAAGNSHSLVLLEDGSVLAWGANHKGQLGDGTNDDRLEPVQVAGLSDVIAISAGFNFNLALTSQGMVWAWGENNWGQLGDGTTNHSSIPVLVANLSGVAAISAGFEHSLALRADGSIWGWGSNHSGQLGDASLIQRHTPVKVHISETLSGPIAAIAAGGFHSLALEQNGRVWTWGGNGYGQLGNGDNTDRWLPVRPVNMYEVTAIAAGFGHCLVLKRDGTVWAWGMNSYGGQLGDNTTNNRSTQVQAQGLPFMSSIAAGTFHSLAM